MRILAEMERQAGRVEYRRCEWDGQRNAVVPECLECLDPSDRKFAAVALSYNPHVPIVNATDPDWAEGASGIAEAGLEVIELCDLTARG